MGVARVAPVTDSASPTPKATESLRVTHAAPRANVDKRPVSPPSKVSYCRGDQSRCKGVPAKRHGSRRKGGLAGRVSCKKGPVVAGCRRFSAGLKSWGPVSRTAIQSMCKDSSTYRVVKRTGGWPASHSQRPQPASHRHPRTCCVRIEHACGTVP